MSALSIKYESYFMNLVYSGAGLQQIVEEGALIIGTPIRFSPENKIEYAVCSSGYPQEDIEQIKQLLKGEGSKLRVFLGVSKREKPDEPFLTNDAGIWEAYIFCNVIIGSRYFGNLSIPQVGIDLKTVDLDFVLLLSHAIALSCAVSGIWGYDVTRDSLLQRILSGTVRSHAEMMAHLGSGTAFEGKRWKLVCARVPEGKSPVIFQTALQRAFQDNLVVVHDQRVVMLVDVTGGGLTQSQWNALRDMAQTYQCTVGVSVDFQDILECREQMLCLTEHPDMARGGAGLFDYAEHMEYLLFFKAKIGRENALRLFGGRMMEIRQYDRENDTRYFDTVCAYLSCSMQVQKTAEMLYAHKNTILYRMTRIQEIFGVDLHDNRDIFELNLGLSALRYWSET